MKLSDLRKHKKFLIAVVCVLAAIAMGAVFLQPKAEPEDDVIWREYPVKLGTITASLDGSGLLEATGIHHSFDVDLKIDQILVEAGQEVKAGDTLVTYSKTALQEKIDELTASLQAAQRALEDAQNNKRKMQLEGVLSQTQGQQDQETAYEGSKREIENAIQNGEHTVAQLQEKVVSLQEELRQVSMSQDGTAASADLQNLMAQMSRLKKDMERLQASNTAAAGDQQIAALVQQRRELYDQLDDIERQIRDAENTISYLQRLEQDLSGVQQQIASLRVQIAELEAAQQQVPTTPPAPEATPDPTTEPTQTPDLPEDPPPTQQPETELFPETAADNGQLSVLKAQLENLLADETRLKAEIDATADPSDQLASLRSQRRSTERSISNVNDQIDAMEDSAQIAEDIQKKQSQIDNLQAQINALSAKEEKIDSLSGQIEKAIEDINTANFDLETQRIALETLETNHSAQVSKTEANQATQSQIDAFTVETLNNAIENAQAEIRSINAELSAAQALLATPALSAKADGVVTLVSYTEGDTVPAGKSVVTIGDSGEKCVAAEIPQEDIGGVELGQAVELQFVADPDNTISGRVVEKNLVPTQGTEGVTYTVKIAFDEPQEELLQGMTCSVKFIQKRVENVLTLANKAITLTDGKQTVIVQMADGSHEEREIKTGFSDGRTSEVTSGLSAGEIVVVAG